MPTAMQSNAGQIGLRQRPISPGFGSEIEDVTLLDMTPDAITALKQLGGGSAASSWCAIRS